MAHRFATTSALRAVWQVCHGGHALLAGRVSSRFSQSSKDWFRLCQFEFRFHFRNTTSLGRIGLRMQSWREFFKQPLTI